MNNDLISRQEVLDYIDSMPSELTADGRRMIRRIRLTEYIQDSLPSAESERKKGKWIWMGDKGDSRFMCSVCKGKENVPTIMGKPTVWDYCPNCGARMDEREEDVEETD